MAPTYKGAISATIESYRYLPDQGWVERYSERGKPDFIEGRVNLYQNAGYHVRVFRDGPYSNLTAERVSPTAAVSFIERWTVGTELLEKDLLAHPTALAEAKNFTGGFKKYKAGIEEAIEDDLASLSSTTYPVGTYPFAHKILEERRRGVEAFERDYLVLSRERSMPLVSSYQLQLAHTRTIYTTSQLNTIENIPASILFSLPADPTVSDPDNEQAQWGWRARDQEAEITSDYRAVLRASYVFAQWSTFLYTPSEI